MRFSMAVFVLCQTVIWTCPPYCSTLPVQSERKESSQPLSGHEHHHSSHDTTSAPDHREHSAATALLTGVHCDGCGVAEPTLLVRSSASFSARPVADAGLATPANMRLHIVDVIHFASSHPPDTSPPPGISPLRI